MKDYNPRLQLIEWEDASETLQVIVHAHDNVYYTSNFTACERGNVRNPRPVLSRGAHYVVTCLQCVARS